MSNKNNIFWISDPSVIYKNNNLFMFMPTQDMTQIEQLNAITRLLIYIFIAIYFYGNMTKYMFKYFLYILLIIIVLYMIIKIREKNNINKDKYTNLTNFPQTVKDINIPNLTNAQNKITCISKFESLEKNRDINLENKLKKYKDRKNKKQMCDKHTIDNPFNNHLTNGSSEPNVVSPYNSNDEDIQTNVADIHNQDLYKNVVDLVDQKTTQRNFYTFNNKDPIEAQNKFIKFAYNIPETCKENSNMC